MHANVVRDGVFEGTDFLKGPGASASSAGKLFEKKLDERKPRCAGRRKVKMKKRAFAQPCADGGMFTRFITIDNEMQSPTRRSGSNTAAGSALRRTSSAADGT